jgi:hypothetical protein
VANFIWGKSGEGVSISKWKVKIATRKYFHNNNHSESTKSVTSKDAEKNMFHIIICLLA